MSQDVLYSSSNRPNGLTYGYPLVMMYGMPIDPQSTQALRDVIAERRHQIDKGYTPEHDDHHTPEEILSYGPVVVPLPLTRGALVRAATCTLAAIERIDRMNGQGGAPKETPLLDMIREGAARWDATPEEHKPLRWRDNAPSGEEAHCPTCGPATTEQHPTRPNITRCVNCKEWLSEDRATN